MDDSGIDAVKKQARTYYEVSDLVASLNSFKHVLNHKPSDTEALDFVRNLAVYELYEATDSEVSEYIRIAERAISCDVKNARGYALMGMILKINGDYSAAIKYWSKACILEPENPDFWTQLGLVHKNNGDIEAGLRFIFNHGVYRKAFSSCCTHIFKSRDVEAVADVLDIQMPLKLITERIPSNVLILVLLFKLDESALQVGTGGKILELLSYLDKKVVAYRMIAPLPPCIFGKHEFARISKFLISANRLPEEKDSTYKQSCRSCAYYIRKFCYQPRFQSKLI